MLLPTLKAAWKRNCSHLLSFRRPTFLRQQAPGGGFYFKGREQNRVLFLYDLFCPHRTYNFFPWLKLGKEFFKCSENKSANSRMILYLIHAPK